MKLLDTSVAIDHLRGVQPAVALLQRLVDAEEPVITSEVVRFELLARLSYVDPDELARRSLARLRVARLLRLADVTSSKAAGFGVTARASAGSNYPRDSQPWARRLAAAGFDGIRYGLSREPGLRLRGLALFGEAGEHPSFGPVDDGPIPEAVVAKAMARFGFRHAP